MRQLRISKLITDRSDAVLDTYIRDIVKEKLLTLDEEIELAKKIKTGDKAALDKLVTANLRFVISVAKQYQGQGMDLIDLISEGNMGLMKAAEGFDETRGFKFISYAVWFIRQAIINTLSDNARVVRLPINQLGTLNKVNKVIQKLEQELEHEPSIDEIAEKAELSIKDVISILNISGKYISLDEPLTNKEEESNTTLVSVIEDTSNEKTDDNLNKESLFIELKRAVATLSKKEQMIITMFYGINYDRQYSLEEIGEEIKLTRERVRQIKEKAVRKLRHDSRSKFLKLYL